MMQRIQSLYWLIAAALLLAAVYAPLASFYNTTDGGYSWDLFGVSTATETPELLFSTWPLFAVILIVITLTMVSIFLFKHRRLQFRLSLFSILMIVGYYGAGTYFYFKITDVIQSPATFQWGGFFPIVAAILIYLAARATWVDEMTVRAADSIRRSRK